MRTGRLPASLFASCSAVVLSALAIPASASAQVSIEVTPFFASFYSASTIRDEDAEGFEERQANAPAVGVKLAFAVAGAVKVEGSVAYARSGTNLSSDETGSTGVGVSLPGNLLIASGRLRFEPRASNFYVLGGAGITKRGGKTWDSEETGVDYTDLTSMMGVVGVGVRARVTPQVALDVGVEANLYNLDPDGEGTLYPSKFQQDILVTIGIPFGFGGGR